MAVVPEAAVAQDTPHGVDGVSASGAPFVQKKRGNLRHALLDSAYRAAAARIAQIDLVGPTSVLLALTAGLAHWGSLVPDHAVSLTQVGTSLLLPLSKPSTLRLRTSCRRMHVTACACALQDVGSLVELARRRCADDKAGVRKAAVQLLEALLLLRASGAGGAEAVLPSGADLEAIQHAAADPMVRPCGDRLKSMTPLSSTMLDREVPLYCTM